MKIKLSNRTMWTLVNLLRIEGSNPNLHDILYSKAKAGFITDPPTTLELSDENIQYLLKLTNNATKLKFLNADDADRFLFNNNIIRYNSYYDSIDAVTESLGELITKAHIKDLAIIPKKEN